MVKLYIILLSFFIVQCKFSDKTAPVGADLINSPVSGSANVDDKNLPVLTFDFMRHDFGKVAQGDKKQVMFTFTNTGKSNLILSSVTASCGCTILNNWPKQPIKPGEKGEIEVEFDTENLRGQQIKNVSILANTFPATTVLNIMAEVIAPEIF